MNQPSKPEGCSMWMHKATDRVVVITGDGHDELSIDGWNRLVWKGDGTSMIVEGSDETERTDHD